MALGFTNPAVRYNNRLLKIVPNSFTMIGGYGEKTVMPQTAGNSVVEMVTFEDVATKCAQLKFEIYTTDENLDDLNEMITQKNSTVTFSENNKVFTVTEASVTNDPEFAYQPEGKAPIEIKGQAVLFT